MTSDKALFDSFWLSEFDKYHIDIVLEIKIILFWMLNIWGYNPLDDRFAIYFKSNKPKVSCDD